MSRVVNGCPVAVPHSHWSVVCLLHLPVVGGLIFCISSVSFLPIIPWVISSLCSLVNEKHTGHWPQLPSWQRAPPLTKNDNTHPFWIFLRGRVSEMGWDGRHGPAPAWPRYWGWTYQYSLLNIHPPRLPGTHAPITHPRHNTAKNMPLFITLRKFIYL